jgi:hypothetical protein
MAQGVGEIDVPAPGRSGGRARRRADLPRNVMAGHGVLRTATRDARHEPRRRTGNEDAGGGGGLSASLPTSGYAGMRIGAAVPVEQALSELRLPPFLLPIYQAAAARYGVPWQVLAAVNAIETDYGRNRGISSAGARGWMQFLPSTWSLYGVDATRDGRADPDNPADAIFAAAAYLEASGARADLRGAILAYNHAGWYADRVLNDAARLSALPPALVDALSSLASGTFPVAGGTVSTGGDGSVGRVVLAAPGAAVRAAVRGIVIRRSRHTVRLRDASGNRYTYAQLGRVSRLRRGTTVARGAALGSVGAGGIGGIVLSIRPALNGAPRIDPAPFLAGWKLLAATGFVLPDGREARLAAAGMSGGALARRVLADPRIHIYPCGRDDIAAGAIDGRVLSTLELLAESGLSPTVTSLRCGHSLLTTSGNVSEHSTGSAVDIAAINGVPVLGHQGEGSLAAQVVRQVLAMPAAMQPHQVISLMTVDGAGNTLAMADHADHIHLGWSPGAQTALGSATRPLSPSDWTALLDRLGTVDPPTVRAEIR